MPINSRDKGAKGERELFALLSDELGYIVKRRLDAPREGGADSLDVPGWSIECKRYAKATRADIRKWWEQAVRQNPEGRRPVLIYRVDRDAWRCVFIVPYLGTDETADWWATYERTVEMGINLWCEIVREGINEIGDGR